jgi:hypothetical protein
MGQQWNRKKQIIDERVLRDHPAIREAHEAWTAVIKTHQSKYYKQRGLHQATVHSIQQKSSNFFPVWEAWGPAAKQLYDQLTAAVGFRHGID